MVRTRGQAVDASQGVILPPKPQKLPRYRREGVFRFMDLPPELRVRVYEYNMGGRIVHRGHPSYGSDGGTFLCKASKPDWKIRTPDLREYQSGLMTRHKRCQGKAYKRHELALLYTCRGLRDLLELASGLTPLQQRGICTVMLYESHNFHQWSDPTPSWHRHAAQTLSPGFLPGLKNLTLYLELVHFDLSDGKRDEFVSILDEQGWQRRFASAVPLASSELQKLDICLGDTIEAQGLDNDLHHAAIYKPYAQRWMEGLKKAMLPM